MFLDNLYTSSFQIISATYAFIGKLALLHLRLKCDKLSDADLEALDSGLKQQTIPH
jgi:hypothetical protein